MTARGVARVAAVFVSVVSVAALGEPAMGETDDSTEPAAGEAYPNLCLPTLGGRQFWGDVCYCRGWRIQQNVLTGHFRLLDPHDARHAWGSQAACRAALARIRLQQQLPLDEGKAVIVVHGIIRSSKSFSRMRAALEQDGYTVIGFDYPSTRVTIRESAEYLQQVISGLERVTEINFIVHSMGGLLVRTYLEEHSDPRFHRMVMLGVPNQGANMANVVQSNPLFKLLFGPAGQQLIDDPEGYIAHLPTPDFEFAIIAGARGTPDGWNPLVPGDDDGTVEVENTKLPGAADFMTVCGMHSFLMDRDDVIDATRRFLATGALRDSGERQPIPRPAPANTFSRAHKVP